jgi:RsiW-degrading membrane proteinase PrsW (M82 family)
MGQLMTRTVLLTAALTGTFCALFALVVEAMTDIFRLWQLILASFVSGSLGSLFAQTALGRWNAGRR